MNTEDTSFHNLQPKQTLPWGYENYRQQAEKDALDRINQKRFLIAGVVAAILWGWVLYGTQNTEEPQQEAAQKIPAKKMTPSHTRDSIMVDLSQEHPVVILDKKHLSSPSENISIEKEDQDIQKTPLQKKVQKPSSSPHKKKVPQKKKTPETKTKNTLKQKPKNTAGNYSNFFGYNPDLKKRVKRVYGHLRSWARELNARLGHRKSHPLYMSEKDIFHLMALFMTESHLKWEQKGTYIGYGQIGAVAQQDVVKYFSKLRGFDREDPRGNTVLAFWFLKRSQQIIDASPKLKWKYDSEFITMAYNLGPGKMKTLMHQYLKDTATKKIRYGSFMRWLVKKVEKRKSGAPKVRYNKSYHVNMKYWLRWDYHWSSWKIRIWGRNFSYNELAQMIEYVEKVNAIETTNQAKYFQKQEMRIAKKQSTQSKNNLSSTQNAHETQNSYRKISNSYRKVKSVPRQWVMAILRKANIAPTKENVAQFVKLNRLASAHDIHPNRYYLVPIIDENS